jgi:hypothetical protein
MAKKKTTKPQSSVTSTTWLLFGIFLVVSAFCFKVILTAQEIKESIASQDPVQVIVVTKTPTKAPAKLK